MAGSAPLKFHEKRGIATRRCRMSLPSAGTKFSFASRSLVHDQLAIGGNRLQNWVTAPVVGLMAIVSPTPPVALTPKKLGTDGPKSKSWESAQMNDPNVVALARRPAAKEFAP